MNITSRGIFDILLSVFFYFQILGVNVLSDIYVWIINIVILVSVATLVRLNSNFSVRRLVPLHIFLIFWVSTDLLILISDFNDIGLNSFALGNLFLIFFQLPFLAYVFTYFYLNPKSYIIFAFISATVSFSLFFLWYIGIIEFFKYQIIGNISLLSFIILSSKEIFQSNKIIRILLQIFLFVIIISVGSRQSLLGFIVLTLIILIDKLRTKPFRAFITSTVSGFIIFILSKVEFIQNLFFQFETINRLISNSQIDSSSNIYRIQSAKTLINNFSLMPNGFSYNNDPYFLEPHNFFLETLYVKGLLLGGIIVLTLFLITTSIFFSDKNKVLKYMILVFIVPSMVSYGIHAARFYLLGILVFLMLKSVSINLNNVKFLKI